MKTATLICAFFYPVLSFQFTCKQLQRWEKKRGEQTSDIQNVCVFTVEESNALFLSGNRAASVVNRRKFASKFVLCRHIKEAAVPPLIAFFTRRSPNPIQYIFNISEDKKEEGKNQFCLVFVGQNASRS